jgi:trk system potassium uptake protein TrkH
MYQEKEWMHFMITLLIGLSLGGLGYGLFYQEKNAHIFRKESLAIVVLVWVLAPLFGALPFILSGHMGFVDAFFESASGFTTTGATILPDVEILPKSLLFWRCFTHWIGGLGIVVLFVAIAPLILGSGNKHLLSRESSATINVEGVRPHLRDAAKNMFYTYLALTIVLALLLLGGNMNFFDAFCHSFSAIATGGFSNYNAQITHFQSGYIEVVLILFMLIGGMNFVLLYNLFFQGKRPLGRELSEWGVYMLLFIFASLFITFFLYGMRPGTYPTLTQALRAAAFAVASFQTTTGFVTDDFDLWPPFCQVILMLLPFLGGCVGSTSGGIKIFRVQIIFEFLRNQIFKRIHFGAVKSIKIAENVVSEETQNEALGIFAIGILSIFIGTLLLAAETDIVSAVTAVIVCTCNCGPGLNESGATESYAYLSSSGKLVLSFCMIIGRLEFFTLLALFSRSFWKA